MTHNSRNTVFLSGGSPSLRRYSLSDIGCMSPLGRDKNKHSPMQGIYNTPELTHKFTHIDSRSPGYTTRIVQYNEEKEKSLPIAQSRYNKPGIFPVVHFFKKDLPLYQRPQVNVRINSPDMSKYNTPEQNRMLLETIIQSSPRNKTVTSPSNEVNTKSVLDALKEISRKRIHSNEEDFIVEEDGDRTCMNYVSGSNLRKKVKFNSSQIEDPINSSRDFNKRGSMDELKASFSSMDGQLVKKFKPTKTSVVAPASPSLKIASPVKSVNVETQTTFEIHTPVTEFKNVSSTNENLKEITPPKKTKKILPVKVFDETPLETMRKNRLVALMGSLSQEKIKEKQDNLNHDIVTTTESKTTPEKPLVSILSGATKDPNKTSKHVTFNIPESSSSTESTNTSSTPLLPVVSAADTSGSPLKLDGFLVTKTSTALVTPIVSSSVVEISPMKKPELKVDNNQPFSSPSNEVKPQALSLPSVITFTPTSATPTTQQLHTGINSNVNTKPPLLFEQTPVTKKDTMLSPNQQVRDSGPHNLPSAIIKENPFNNNVSAPAFTMKPPENPQNNKTTEIKFTFGSNITATKPAMSLPLQMSFGQPSLPTSVVVPSKPVLFDLNQKKDDSKVTTSTSVLSQVTTSNTMGGFSLFPTPSTPSSTLASSIKSFQPSSNIFNNVSTPNFGSPSSSNVFSSEKEKKLPSASSGFTATINDNKNQLFSTTALTGSSQNNTTVQSSTNASFFMTPSNVTSKPGFTFSSNFKTTTTGLSDSIPKFSFTNATTPATVASIPSLNPQLPQLHSVTQPNAFSNEATSAFNKPNTSITFGPVFGSANTNAGTVTNSTPSFGNTSFNTNTKAFTSNNTPFPSFKNDKPTFGQESTPQFGVTTTVFSGNTVPTFQTTSAFPAPSTTANNIFGNTFGAPVTTANAFGTPTTSAPTFNTTTKNFGTSSFGTNQNNAFNNIPNNDFKTNPTPGFGNVFGAVTTASSFNSSGGFQSSNVFTPSFGDNSAPKTNSFEVAPFQSTPNAFGSSSFSVNPNPPVTQGDVFTFGANTNKPPVFSFGNTEPPKPTFSFGADNNTNTFSTNNKSFGGAFTSPAAPQFNMAPTGPPNMFNIGAGSTTPNRSRTQIKAKRRT